MIKWIIFIILLSIWITNTYATVYKKNATDAVNEKVRYAYSLSNSKVFVAMLEAENSTWNEYRKSNKFYYRKWKKWYDVWICQISQYYHPQIVNNKNFYNWKWQIDTCYKMYKGWVKFYWLKNVKKTILRFNFN